MLFLLRCGVPDDRQLDTPILPGERVESLTLPELPGRRDLKFLDPLPGRFTVGHTETLEELTQRPDVPSLGEPRPDPHEVSERVRVIVHGSDAALSAVVAKLMRIDALWVEVAYVPLSPDSLVATVWGIDATAHPRTLLTAALAGSAVPVPLIRDDHGLVTLGLAEITGPKQDGIVQPLVGEIIVDSETIYANDATGRDQRGNKAVFTNGVRMVPTPDAPGLAAVQRPPLPRRALFGLVKRPVAAEPSVLKGRALQAGGEDMRVIRDGVEHPRPLQSVTFYRHLRDGQFVRQ
ncbi:hypothetical protein [Corynebacterium falsenii]|uniref:hypothetical protein n=1 Tax=Corynebacterium falsenii TaxID=108486 RepID=UPI003FCF1D6C